MSAPGYTSRLLAEAAGTAFLLATVVGSGIMGETLAGGNVAIALLATLYGAELANLVCLPIADKLQVKLHDEETNRTLIIDGVLMIREAKSPAIVREMLVAYLPGRHHHAAEAVPA